MSELNEAPLPCPFCGIEPRFCAVTDLTDKFDHGYTISCDTCGIEMADEYKSGVAEAWNRRAPYHASEPDAVAVERDRCLRIAEFYSRHNGDDDAWEMCAQWIARDIQDGQDPLTDEQAAILARSQP